MTICEAIFDHYAVKEIAGEAENNPEILQFFKELNQSWVKTDETSWCAALVNASLKKGGFPTTEHCKWPLAAKSLIAIGERISTPRPLGTSFDFVDLCLFYRGRPWKDENPDNFEPGHAGFFIKERGMTVHSLSGNQGNMLNISGYDRNTLEFYIRVYKLRA
ncbi:MAG: hypothetical protein V2B15_06525 [Bacteroidota bacterium]